MRANTPYSYGSVARTLHWLTAFIILSNIGLGLTAHRWPMEGMDVKIQLFSLHKTLGIAAFSVALIRILWALSQPRPGPVHADRPAETMIAETAHWMLYIAMLVVPLAGWAEHAATEGFAPILWPFGQGFPMIPKSGHLAEILAVIHRTFAWILIVTVVLHIAGAMKHAVVDRDGVLGRMVTGRVAGSAPPRHHVMPMLLAAAIFTGGGGYALATATTSEASSTSLERPVSDWQVTDGAIGFSVAQMGTAVTGQFDDWTAAISFDEATSTGDVTVTINMSSVRIGTVSDQAKGAAFFDVATHPTAVFSGTIRPDGDRFMTDGTLLMKGATMPVVLPFTLKIADNVATMTGAATLDRRDWQVGAGYADETTVGFSVALDIALTATRPASSVRETGTSCSSMPDCP